MDEVVKKLYLENHGQEYQIKPSEFSNEDLETVAKITVKLFNSVNAIRHHHEVGLVQFDTEASKHAIYVAQTVADRKSDYLGPGIIFWKDLWDRRQNVLQDFYKGANNFNFKKPNPDDVHCDFAQVVWAGSHDLGIGLHITKQEQNQYRVHATKPKKLVVVLKFDAGRPRNVSQNDVIDNVKPSKEGTLYPGPFE